MNWVVAAPCAIARQRQGHFNHVIGMHGHRFIALLKPFKLGRFELTSEVALGVPAVSLHSDIGAGLFTVDVNPQEFRYRPSGIRNTCLHIAL